MNYLFETERLRLREFNFEDTQFIIELLNSAGWLKYIGDRNVVTREQAKAYLENGPIKSYKENGFGLSLVEKKDDFKPIGMCGIIKRDTLENPDIGFAFLPCYSGKGYAYEIVSETLKYARNKLKIDQIAAITLPGNERSIRLLSKVRFKFIKTVCFPQSKEELLLYSN